MKTKLFGCILSVCLGLVSFLPLPSSAKIVMKPYLQAVTQNSIAVMVVSDSKDVVTVNFGKDEKLGESAKTAIIAETDNHPSTYVHKVVLKSLLPNGTYYYNTSQGSQTTEISHFRTAVTEGTPFRMAVAGDFRSNPTIHNQIANFIRKAEPYFSLYVGDLCFGIKYSFWKEDFLTEPELNLDAVVPFFNAVGNHEGWEQNTIAFTAAPESPSGRQEYYSFDYGDAHILVLSTQHSCKPNSEQYKFAEADLKATNKKWKIVTFHEPAYSFGSHFPNKYMKAMSENIFEKTKVDLVFTGHNHYYQHNLVNGIHHFVMGGGGAPLYTPKTSPNTLKSEKAHHYGIADVTATTFSMKVYNLKGEVIDTIELKK